MASYYGKNVHISIFGQSHGPAIGVTVDGLPAGEPVDVAVLRTFLARRAPGNGPLATPRREGDEPVFLSGLVADRTCGAPLTAVIYNQNCRSGDYSPFRDQPRPGHADYTAELRYDGFQDMAGGGHFSGRLTAPLCIAGGICRQILARRGITVNAHVLTIGSAQDRHFDPMGEQDLSRLEQLALPVLEPAAGEAMEQEVLQARAAGDSMGGVVECLVQGYPAGVGDPMFGGLESRLSAILFGIPAVKGLEFGAGFSAAELRGTENNDAFCLEAGCVRTRTNHHGGILGGISSGMPILFRLAFKPTPSVAAAQRTLRLSTGEEEILEIRGRHDPCIVPRAVPVVEAAAAAALLDALLDTGKWEELK